MAAILKYFGTETFPYFLPICPANSNLVISELEIDTYFLFQKRSHILLPIIFNLYLHMWPCGEGQEKVPARKKVLGQIPLASIDFSFLSLTKRRLVCYTLIIILNRQTGFSMTQWQLPLSGQKWKFLLLLELQKPLSWLSNFLYFSHFFSSVLCKLLSNLGN